MHDDYKKWLKREKDFWSKGNFIVEEVPDGLSLDQGNYIFVWQEALGQKVREFLQQVPSSNVSQVYVHTSIENGHSSYVKATFFELIFSTFSALIRIYEEHERHILYVEVSKDKNLEFDRRYHAIADDEMLGFGHVHEQIKLLYTTSAENRLQIVTHLKPFIVDDEFESYLKEIQLAT